MRYKKIIQDYLPAVILLVASLFLLAKPILDMDEIWNYNFASSICKGLRPYEDFNMIQTPLAAYIGSLFLTVFGNSLLTFRILGILLFAVTFWLLYRICRAIISNAHLAFVSTVFAYGICSIVWIYNYNSLNLLMILTIISCELYLEKKPNVNKVWLNVVIGFIFGIIPLIKQSTGAVLFCYNIGYCIYGAITKWKDRGSGIYVKRMAVSFISIGIFVASLLLTGSYQAFLDYAVKGIGSFTHRENWFDYIMSSGINFGLGMFPLIVTVISIVVIIKKQSRISRKFHINTLIISWAAAFVAYPICDHVHMCIAAVPFVICLLCCVGKLQLSTRDGVVCSIVAAVILIYASIINLEGFSENKICELPYFAGLPINESAETQICAVQDYILDAAQDGKEVIIADQNAAVCMIPIDKHYQDFDLLLVGNVGTKTVEDLLWREDVIYLVTRDDGTLGMQAHRELIDYIKQNYTKIGEVQVFDAYTPGES